MDGEITPAIGPTACRSWHGPMLMPSPGFEFRYGLGLVVGQSLEDQRADQRAAQRPGRPVAKSIGGPAWQNSPFRSPRASRAGRTSTSWARTASIRCAASCVGGVAARVGEHRVQGGRNLGVVAVEDRRAGSRRRRPRRPAPAARRRADRYRQQITSGAVRRQQIDRFAHLSTVRRFRPGRPRPAGPPARPRRPAARHWRRTPCAGGDKRGRLSLPVLRVGGGAAQRDDDRQDRAGSRGRRDRVRGSPAPAAAAGSGSAAWPRTTSSSMTRDVGIGGLLGQQVQPQRRVDHRVRPADGEFVIAEVDDHVAEPGQVRKTMSAAGSAGRAQRDVRPDVAQIACGDDHRLVGQGAAGDTAREATPGLAAAVSSGRQYRQVGHRPRRGPRSTCLGAGGDVRLPGADQHRGHRRAQAAASRAARRRRSPGAAVWRSARCGRCLGRRRACCRAVIALRPPTASDRSRPPTPSTCETATPASSSRQVSCWAPVPEAATMPTRGPADRGAQHIGEAEPNAADDARFRSPVPCTRTPAAAAGVLDRDLVGDGTLSEKIITCRPGVDGVQSLARAPRGRAPRASTRAASGWAAAAARTVRGRAAPPDPPGCAGSASGGQGGLQVGQRRVDGRVVGPADGDQQVVRAGPVRDREPQPRSQFGVQRGCHRHLRGC